MERVHIVTVLYNSAETLRAFAEGVIAQGDLVGAVTVVDNGSRDGSADRARSELSGLGIPVRVLEQGNRGFAGGYAAAAAPTSDGLSVLCVNPDVRLAAGVAADLLRVLAQEERAGIVTAPLIDLDGGSDTATRRKLPRLGASAIYSLLGSRTPARWRYNDRVDSPMRTIAGMQVSVVEATTGALMLLRPSFRDITAPVFDTDYWMYGEDLQLCADAAEAGLEVLVVERDPSLHLKGASSGRPRSLRSNVAFHTAMRTYARKNLTNGSPVLHLLVSAAITSRLLVDEARNQPVKALRRVRARSRARAPKSAYA